MTRSHEHIRSRTLRRGGAREPSSDAPLYCGSISSRVQTGHLHQGNVPLTLTPNRNSTQWVHKPYSRRQRSYVATEGREDSPTVPFLPRAFSGTSPAHLAPSLPTRNNVCGGSPTLRWAQGNRSTIWVKFMATFSLMMEDAPRNDESYVSLEKQGFLFVCR